MGQIIIFILIKSGSFTCSLHKAAELVLITSYTAEQKNSLCVMFNTFLMKKTYIIRSHLIMNNEHSYKDDMCVCTCGCGWQSLWVAKISCSIKTPFSCWRRFFHVHHMCWWLAPKWIAVFSSPVINFHRMSLAECHPGSSTWEDTRRDASEKRQNGDTDSV